MRVLLVKTSSMGDVLHTLPALSDAKNALPEIEFDWLVEESFAEIPAWHSAVKRVIPITLRQWRKQWLTKSTRQDLSKLRQTLKSVNYDLIIDAQGLIKSAFLTYFARGKRTGLNWSSAREALASLAYQERYPVNFQQHAVVRMRSLFQQALKYDLPDSPPDFGISRQQFQQTNEEPYLIFLHATTWQNKQWPEIYWQQLAKLAAAEGFRIQLSGGNAEELARAQRIAQSCTAVTALPRQSIVQMAHLLANAKGVVAVDTGFGHLAGALGLPTLSLYGPTNAVYTGVLGTYSKQMSVDFSCAPCLQRTCGYAGDAEVQPACFSSLPPRKVWQVLKTMMG